MQLIKKFFLENNFESHYKSENHLLIFHVSRYLAAHIYKNAGYKVVHNTSGANLKDGITTMLLENCTISGKVKGDVIVFEMDERFAKFVFCEI